MIRIDPDNDFDVEIVNQLEWEEIYPIEIKEI